MNTEDSRPSVRYVTLRDYLRVLRRYAILIALVAAVGTVAGFIYTATTSSSYKSTAEVNFQDPTQSLGIVGLAANSVLQPGQLAAVGAELANGPTVMNQVKQELGTSIPEPSLASAVSGQVSPSSALLQITATSSDSAFSASLANTTARVLVDQQNAQTRSQYAQLARTVENRIAALTARGAASNPSLTSQLNFYEDELGRLQTLASFAKTATFAKSAVTSSTSPSKVRGTLLGLLFGLLVGILVAFLRDSMDRRLRDSGDFRFVDLPVLGHVRNRALGKLVQLGRTKAERGDLEAFRILRRNLELLDPDHPPKRVLVTSPVAEEGKTTVAASLAVVLASAGRTTLLVEADLRRPSLSSRLGVAGAPGLSDYLSGQAQPGDILRTIQFGEPSHGAAVPGKTNGRAAGGALYRLVLIPSGSESANSAELLRLPAFKEFLDQVSETYDVVVIDSSPLLPVSDTLELMPHVDAVVMCVREGHTTREQASAAREVLGRFPDRRAGLVVTGVRPRAGEDVVYSHTYQYT